MASRNASSKFSRNKIFKCRSHASNIADKLQIFYERKEFFDVVLVAGIDNVKVQAHRIVLSAASDYFLGMFRSTLMEAKMEEIKLEAIEGTTLKLIVDFIYTASIELSSRTIESILRAADFFQVNTLITACFDYVSEQMDISNCLGVALLAEQHSCRVLYEKASSFAYKHFDQVCRETEFYQLNEKQLTEFLAKVPSHENVFHGIVAWVKHDKANREKFLHRLLSRVRYDLLDPKFIIDNSKSVCKTIECHELIRSWLEWHLSPESRSLNPTSSPEPRNPYKLYFVSPDINKAVQVHIFSPQLNKWSYEEWPYPADRKDRFLFGQTVANEKWIISGGLINNCTTNVVECLDLQSLDWTDLPPMKEARLGAGLSKIDGDLYVVGGNGNQNELRSVEKYDFFTCKWQNVEPLRIKISNVEVVALKDLLYVIGAKCNALECYNPATNKWTRTAFKNIKTANCSLAAVNEHIYAVGGTEIDGRKRVVVECYNPSNNSWTVVRPISQWYEIISCCAFNNRLIICGKNLDYDNFETTSIEEYNPQTDEWKMLPSFASKYSFTNVRPQLFSM